MSKKVALLIGGGDVPGLNMCLKSLVYRIIDLGFEPIGVRKGWEGLINYNPDDPTTYGEYFINLTKNIVRPIDRTPGSFLHASRINPLEMLSRQVPEFLRHSQGKTQDVTEHIKDVIKQLGFSALLIIGDDDMLFYAAYLSKQGVPIIAIPKTIHNNINGTDYTLGFSTAVARGVAFIHELRALAGSREQVIVVETSSANSGLSSLLMAFLAGANRALIPEVSYDPEKLARLIIRDKKFTPGNYAIVTVGNGTQIMSEKIIDYSPYLSTRSKSVILRQMPADKAKELRKHKDFEFDDIAEENHSLTGSGLVVAELLQKLIREEVFTQTLSYLLRTGQPDGQDLFNATNFAFLAARLLKQEKFGRMTAHKKHYLTDVDLNLVNQGVNTVNVDLMYDINTYKPKVDVIWSAHEK